MDFENLSANYKNILNDNKHSARVIENLKEQIETLKKIKTETVEVKAETEIEISNLSWLGLRREQRNHI